MDRANFSCRSMLPDDTDLRARICVLGAERRWFSYRDEKVVRTLESACARSGYPKTISVELDSELKSRDLDLWDYTHCVAFDFSRPRKPTDNAVIELQRVLPGGMLERELVPNTCRRAEKDGGLA